ncbi:MAG: FkbM family methyltransferase [Alkalilacustris sp.]
MPEITAPVAPSVPFTLRAFRFVLHALKLNSGSHRLCNNAVVRSLVTRIGAATVSTPTPGGFTIDVDVNDYNGRKLFLFGTNDWKINRTVNALLFAGDVFLDVGANYGTFGFGAAGQVGPGGAVHMFEPQPQLASRIAAAIERRGASNVQIHDVALGSAPATLPLMVPAGHSGRGSLVAPSASDGEQTLVEVRVAQDVAGTLSRDRPFGAKIDAEGADLDIIRGVAGLENCAFILYEGGEDRERIYRLLRGCGYAVFGLSRSLLVPSVVAIRDAATCRDFHDAVAIRMADRSGTVTGPEGTKVSLPRLRDLARKQRKHMAAAAGEVGH